MKKRMNQKGYSLGEALIVVAIIVVLLAIAIPSVMAIRKNMRQTELDTKAETIYEAVQNQLVKMRTSGNTAIYQYQGDDAENGVHRFDNIPWDAEYGSVAPGDICYITSDEMDPADGTLTAASFVMEEGVVDEELRGNHWVIEFNPLSGSVYAVFYSEGADNCAQEYKDNWNKYDQSLRNKAERKADGPRVGYYTGHTIAKINNVKSLRPTLTITNAETLTASIVCTVPVNFSENRPVFKVQIKDTKGHTYIRYYTYWDVSPEFKTEIEKEMTSTANSTHVSVEELNINEVQRTGRRYSLDLVLDDLSSQNTRFAYVYGAGSDNNVKLASGTPLEITVTAMCPGNYTVTQNRSATAYTNSLFADVNVTTSTGNLNTAYGTAADNAAVVSYARHLQNMDQSSGVDGSVQYFIQGADINFNDSPLTHDAQDWYETYHAAFFNGFTSGGYPNFKPIENNSFVSFVGRNVKEETRADGTTVPVTYTYRIAGLHEEVSGGNGGLFGILGNNQTLSYVSLTRAEIVGSENYAVGTLVGYVNGDASIDHCQSYLTSNDVAGKSNLDFWVSGATAVGGLIGTVGSGNLTIEYSSASTVLGAFELDMTMAAMPVARNMTSDYAGGLIGVIQGGSVSITRSYADCYVAGKYAGGLIGNVTGGSLNILASYAAGFISYTTLGAGIVNGNAVIKDSYTNMYRQYLPPFGTTEIPYYAVAESGVMTNVYYESGSRPATVNELSGTRMISSMETEAEQNNKENMDYLRDLLNAGTPGAFTMNNTGSTAYNLMGQTLSAYSYPGISSVTHYGDWRAEFQPGALVYYEVYKDASGKISYGFYGANVESSLKENLEVIGDGYGFVFRKPGTSNSEENEDEKQESTGTLPDNLLVFIGDEEIRTQQSSRYPEGYPINGNDNCYKTEDGYFIYPLEKEIVNTPAVQDKFYTMVMVYNTATNRADYYYYNPLFAKTVVSIIDSLVAAPVMGTDSIISIRSARHLYDMSLYYDSYAEVTAAATYLQERNITYNAYDWANFTLRTGALNFQAPISGRTQSDGKVSTFKAAYNGQGFWITNVSFVSDSDFYTGFIGVNEGTIENVVLRAEYTEGSTSNYYVARRGDVMINQTLYQGVLVGRNAPGGYVMNSAVAGYYLSGSDGTIHAYENSYVYAGGLVGSNAGTIENCSADTPDVRVSANYANVSIGGFVGYNESTIRDSYALGHIEVTDAKGGNVSIAGFAGMNGGVIRDSYCVTALTAGGETTTAYGFSPVGGGSYNCTFLNGGTYTYIDHMYPFNTNLGAGTAVLYGNMKLFEDDMNAAKYSYNFNNTETASSMYPFRAVVRNMRGELVHYGDWLDDEDLGSVGLFYWEHEQYGTNDGYHLTFLGMNGDSSVGGTTLCTSHNDGGIITEYGYGYYEKNLGATSVKVTDAYINGGDTFSITGTDYETALNNSKVNKEASLALHDQIFYTTSDGEQAPYYFFAFTTRPYKDVKATGSDNGNYVCMHKTNDNDATNATIQLTYRNATTAGGNTARTYTYTFCPFFANAMQMANGASVRGTDGTVTNFSHVPGKATNGVYDNPYEIRSILQLQFINWKTAGAGNNETYAYSYKDTINEGHSAYFPYASSSSGDNNPKYMLQFSQTHDVSNNLEVDANGNVKSARFYPLGRAAKSFKMLYNGNSYQIRNLWIEESTSSYVGLFGQIGNTARLENMILTADPGLGKISSSYKAGGDNYREPAVGAFAGLVWVNVNGSPVMMKNCSASGYVIEYTGTVSSGFGRYVTMGGLVGSLFSGSIENCSAANYIQMNGRINNAPQHLGGLIGSAGSIQYTLNVQSNVRRCYSGGTISTVSSYNIVSGGLIGNAKGHPEKAGVTDRAYGYSYDSYTYCDSLSVWTNGAYQTARHPLCGNSNGTITNCYYLKREGKDTSNRALTYEEMSNGTLLAKLNGLTGTGGVGTGVTAFHNVTTTEGADNVSISGKYSFPLSSHLIGKNYPFPAIIQQKDITFSTANNPVYVFVHYGDWPMADAFWTEGRGSMDIFTDMQSSGYAEKVFKIDINERVDLGNVQMENFTINESIAKITDVHYSSDGKFIEVTIQAVNTGTTYVTMETESQEAVFTLEVTANMLLSSDKEKITLDTRENSSSATVTFTAVDKASGAIDYSSNDNGTWEVISENEEIVSGAKTGEKNVWNVNREGLGETILEVRYTYDYHSDENPGAVFTTMIYLDVIQPDTIGLSDNTRYSVAFMGSTSEGESQNYKDFKPENTDGDFYLYMNSESEKLSDMQILEIYVGELRNEVKAVKTETGEYSTAEKFTTSGSDSLVGYYLQWSDKYTADNLYQYLSGTIYHITDGDAKKPMTNVSLIVKVKDDKTGSIYTLNIVLPSVANKKQITITYFDSEAENANAFVIHMLSGEYTLMTPEAIQEAAALQNVTFVIPDSVEFSGWTVRDDETGALKDAGYHYDNLTDSITFIACWVNTYKVTYVANGGAFAEGFISEGKYREGSSFELPTDNIISRSGWTFSGWVDADDPEAGAVTSVTGLNKDMTFVAQWYRNVKITLKDASLDQNEGYQGFTTWLWNDGSVGVTLYDQVEKDDVNFPDHRGYTLLGWYEMNTNEDGELVPGPMVLDATGKFVLNVPGYTDEDSLNLPDEVSEFTLYAYWGRDNSTKVVFAYTEDLVKDGEYLIVDSNAAGTANVMTPANTQSSVTIQTPSIPSFSRYGAVDTYITAEGNYNIANNSWKDTTKEITIDGEKAYYQHILVNDTARKFLYIGYPDGNAALTISDSFTPPATGWTYDRNSHRLMAAEKWLGALWDDPAKTDRVSTGVFALSTNPDEQQSPITNSYLYQRVTIYEKTTFIPTYEVKLFAYEANPVTTSQPDLILDVVENADKLSEKNMEVYSAFAQNFTGTLNGWYTFDSVNNTYTEVIKPDGTMPNHVVHEDVSLIAQWAVVLHPTNNAAEDVTLTFYGTETDLKNFSDYPAMTDAFTGWFAKSTTGYELIAGTDGLVINGKRLSDYTDLYAGASVNLHYDQADETKTVSIAVNSDITTLSTQTGYPETSGNFDGWYVKETAGYTRVTDATGAVVGSLNLAMYKDLYAGWSVKLHTGSADTDATPAASVVVYAATTDLNVAGYPSLPVTIEGWYTADKVQITNGTARVNDTIVLANYSDLYYGWKLKLVEDTSEKNVLVFADTNAVDLPTITSNFDGWFTVANSNIGTMKVKTDGSVDGNLIGISELHAVWSVRLHLTAISANAVAYQYMNAATLAGSMSANGVYAAPSQNWFTGWYQKSEGVYTKIAGRDGAVEIGKKLQDYSDLYGGWTIRLYTNSSQYTEEIVYAENDYLNTRASDHNEYGSFAGWVTGGNHEAVTSDFYTHEVLYASYMKTEKYFMKVDADKISDGSYLIVSANKYYLYRNGTGTASGSVTPTGDRIAFNPDLLDRAWTLAWNGNHSSFSLKNGGYCVSLNATQNWLSWNYSLSLTNNDVYLFYRGNKISGESKSGIFISDTTPYLTCNNGTFSAGNSGSDITFYRYTEESVFTYADGI